MDTFSISLPLTGEYLTTVRLTTGGLCALLEFDVDTAEDFKVCVTESLLLLKRNGYTRADITFTVGKTLAFFVCGVQKTGEVQEGMEDEISYALLSALLGQVDMQKDEQGQVQKIAFEG